jgi:small subunit ribosomal protein S17
VALAPQAAPGRKNQKVGLVVSTKMRKTIVVEVSRRVAHPHYKKVIRRRKHFYAHDEDGQAHVGDTVRIVECRPLSRLKRWRLAEIVRRAALVGVEDTETSQPEPAAIPEPGA